MLGYGGAAGGGKTDLGIGLAIERHKDSIIFRRTYRQLQSIVDRLGDLLGEHGHWQGLQQRFLFGDKTISVGSMQHAPDAKKYRGRPRDLMIFDEATEFTREQVFFPPAWLRSVSGVKPLLMLAFNPPTDSTGAWVIEYFAPWLDKNHPDYPAPDGEIRYFIDFSEEVPGPEAIERSGHLISPESRTFVRAQLSDNQYLDTEEYRRRLDNLREPFRSQLRDGNFDTDSESDFMSVIPRAWVDLAIERWRSMSESGLVSHRVTAVGIDVARGGLSETVMAKRRADFFDNLIVVPGEMTPSGDAVVTLMESNLEPKADDDAVIYIDLIGIGSSPYDGLKRGKRHIIGVNSASGSSYRDRSGMYQMGNKRAEMYWRFGEALDPTSTRQICLPPDPELVADLTAPRWIVRGDRIFVEDKASVYDRTGRGLHRSDAVVMTGHSTSTGQLKVGGTRNASKQ